MTCETSQFSLLMLLGPVQDIFSGLLMHSKLKQTHGPVIPQGLTHALYDYMVYGTFGFFAVLKTGFRM